MSTISYRHQQSTRKDKGRILDESTAVTGLYRKHAIRLLAASVVEGEQTPELVGRRVYDEAVREAVIVVWEASDRSCGKRLQTVLPHLVESMEYPGHLQPDSLVREPPLAASASTLDRLIKPPGVPLAAAGAGGEGNPWDARCRYGSTTTGTGPTGILGD